MENTTETRDKLTKLVKDTVELLANTSLRLDIETDMWHKIYTENNLLDASIVFMHIISNIWILHLIDKGLNEEQITELVEEFGKNIRQTVLLFTWLDTHELVNNYKENNG